MWYYYHQLSITSKNCNREVFIANTARGKIVDPKDMAEAVESVHVVWFPLPALRHAMTPHYSGTTLDDHARSVLFVESDICN